MKRQDIENLFFTPAELSAAYVAYGDYIQKTPGVKFHVKKLDDYVIPPRAGQLVVAVARPGQGKTSFAIAYAKKTVDDIVSRGAQSEEAVVYVTYDQPVEEISSMYLAETSLTVEDYAWGRVPHKQLAQKSNEMLVKPFWVIGRGVTRLDKQADMSFENVFSAIGMMKQKFGVKPSLLIVDYIQNIIIPHKQRRSEMVAEASIQAKDLAKQLGCPLLVLAQAGRQVDSSDSHIPGLADCQHSSQLEQDATKVFGLMRPKVAMPKETEYPIIDDNGQESNVPITENLLLLQVVKQRMTKAGKTFGLFLNPATMELEDLYTQQQGGQQ